MTRAEEILWQALRGRGFEDLKFRRQAPIGPYIVDFACLKARLIIELDGGIHDAPFYDVERQKAREAWLLRERYRVLRLKNHEVEGKPHAVLERIRSELGIASPLDRRD